MKAGTGDHRHRALDRRTMLQHLGLGAAGPVLPVAMAGGAIAQERTARGGMPIGCAVQRKLLDEDAAYREAIRRYCDLVVTEDALKWDTVRPTRGTFDFADADAIVAFAQAVGLGVRGHALVYHGQVPAWIDEIRTREDAEYELRRHIETVAGRYKGVIGSYDVVNEFTDDRPEVGLGLRPTLWMRLIGQDYIELAFRTAAAADPAAKLVLSDYFLENQGDHYDARRAVMLRTVRRLITRGVPIHAVGIQGHVYADRRVDRAALIRFTADLKALGVGVVITEFDMIDQAAPADIAQRDDIAAAYAFALIDAVAEGGGLQAVLTWGITDRYSWTSWHKPRADGLPTRPLPLDEQFRPKPMSDVLQHFRRWVPPQTV